MKIHSENALKATTQDNIVYMETPSVRTARKKLISAVNNNEFLTVYGPIGAGKTTFMRSIIGEMELKEGKNIVINMHAWRTTKIAGIMRAMVQKISGHASKPRRGADALNEQVKNHLIQYSRDKKIILVIDDAQDLSEDTLLDLKKLREISYGTDMHLFSIILFAHPEIKDIIDNLKILRYRVQTARINPFTMEQKIEFIKRSHLFRMEPKLKTRFIKASPETPGGIISYYKELKREASDMGFKEISSEIFNIRQARKLEIIRSYTTLSQSQFARELGVDKGTYSRIQNGHDVSQTTISKIDEAAEKFLSDSGLPENSVRDKIAANT